MRCNGEVCEHGRQTSGSIKVENFITVQLSGEAAHAKEKYKDVKHKLLNRFIISISSVLEQSNMKIDFTMSA
jgi:hypothetical protein